LILHDADVLNGIGFVWTISRASDGGCPALEPAAVTSAALAAVGPRINIGTIIIIVACLDDFAFLERLLPGGRAAAATIDALGSALPSVITATLMMIVGSFWKFGGA
jgi:hypothetical protein